MTTSLSIEEVETELLTCEEFGELDLDEKAELVDGKIELMGNNNPNHSEVLSNLNINLGNFVKDQKLGKVYCGDVSVLVRRDPDTTRGLDLAFLSHESLKNQPEDVSSIQVPPDLAIEITSPGNSWDRILTKIKEYFTMGVREVWVISVGARQVSIYSSPKDCRVFLLEDGDKLSCEPILPGFEIALENIFEGLLRDSN